MIGKDGQPKYVLCQLPLLIHAAFQQKKASFIFHSNEGIPGNVLSADAFRKVQFAFGAVALSKEEAWFCIMTCR